MLAFLCEGLLRAVFVGIVGIVQLFVMCVGAPDVALPKSFVLRRFFYGNLRAHIAQR